MIQPRELRIGNIVSYNPKLSNPQTTLPPVLIEVSAILPDKIGYAFPNLEHRVEPFEDDLLQMQMRYRLLAEVEPIALSYE